MVTLSSAVVSGLSISAISLAAADALRVLAVSGDLRTQYLRDDDAIVTHNGDIFRHLQARVGNGPESADEGKVVFSMEMCGSITMCSSSRRFVPHCKSCARRSRAPTAPRSSGMTLTSPPVRCLTTSIRTSMARNVPLSPCRVPFAANPTNCLPRL